MLFSLLVFIALLVLCIIARIFKSENLVELLFLWGFFGFCLFYDLVKDLGDTLLMLLFAPVASIVIFVILVLGDTRTPEQRKRDDEEDRLRRMKADIEQFGHSCRNYH